MNKSAGKDSLTLLTVVVVFLLLPSFLLFIIEQIFVIQTGWVSYEMLSLSLLVLILSPIAVAFIYLVLIFLQVLFAVGPAYHLSLESAVGWVISVFDLPDSYRLTALLLVIFFLTVGFFAASKIRRRGNGKSIVVSVCFLLFVGIVVDRILEPLVGRNYVTSNFISLYQVARNELSETASRSNGNEPSYIPSGSEVLFSALEQGRPLPKKILLVIVESLGLGNKSTQTYQYKGIIESRLNFNRYAVEYGRVPFKGSTVPGEFRELCQRITRRVILKVSESISKQCLPNLFTEAGYSASAYHGYSGGYFDRFRLYREFGFSHRFFANKLLSTYQYDKRCGFLIFEGLCDADIAESIGSRFRENAQSEFVYWLTLNGHQPLLGPPTVGDYLDCEQMEMSSESHCRTVQHAQVVTNSILDIIDDTPDIGIVMVGDHSPGGINTDMDARSVPVITIFPKSI